MECSSFLLPCAPWLGGGCVLVLETMAPVTQGLSCDYISSLPFQAKRCYLPPTVASTDAQLLWLRRTQIDYLTVLNVRHLDRPYWAKIRELKGLHFFLEALAKTLFLRLF